MKLTKSDWFSAGGGMGLKLELGLGLALCLLWMALGSVAGAQAVSTTTVQGTVYLANGQVGSGTLVLNWPAFTTANGQSVAADSETVTIPPDGFISVNLAPNQGATPAGQYYTAIYHLSDGTTTTQYWVVPAAAQASLAQVQAQLMPAAQAVQAVSKTYVDQVMAELEGSLLTASGGNLTGPLYLNGDPTQPLQAADKHYVDAEFALALPLAGGNMTGALQTPAVNGVQSPAAGSSQPTLQAAVNAAGTRGAVEIPPAYTGTDGFTNPNGVYVKDLRTGSAQQTERSVKEFGAVCDGVTDDTNALQSALNYANAHGVALTIPQGTCKTRSLNWKGESIGGLGKQVSALMGFPGQDVLATTTDSVNLLMYTRIHDLTIYVDQSVDVSCSPAEGRASAGTCAVGRLMEKNSIFSPGGNGLTGAAGTGAGWSVGNCAIAMPAATGAGGNGLRVAEMENVEIAATGTDPMAAQYPGAHSTHTCGLYLAQWPQWSEFRNIDIRGLNTGIAIPALPGTTPAGLNADSNRWQNITIQATHAFTAAAGSNNVLDNVVAVAGNSAATAEPPTGLVLDLTGTQQGWTLRNAVVLPTWTAVQPQLTVTASGGAVTAVTVGSEHGLGFDPYGTQVPIAFSGSCTAQAVATVNSNGAIGTVSVTQGGGGCSGTTTASVNAAGTWDTAAPVNLIGGQEMTLFAGNLLKGNGGYTVWNASSSQSHGTQMYGGGGNLPGGGTYSALVANSALGTALEVGQFPGADFGAKVQACLGALSATYGGTCDARNFTGSLSMGSNLTISTANAAVLLPCATIATANQVIVTAGTRNVSLRGCSLLGGSAASSSQGGTAFLYSGTSAMVQVGDPTYAVDTPGFRLDNAVINTTAASSATAQGLVAYRTQEMNLEDLYFLGNSNQTGMTLDGTGNYTGGSFSSSHFSGFQTAVNAIGHQVANAATTDWLNASTFVRMHIDCPTSNGNPISGTYGINLQQGDGNSFTGGDVEGCNTALHLGPNAQNNTITGLRNENSTNQVVADAGSSYNSWIAGGTMFTGELTDNGQRNSFLDTFHRSFNGIKGDWYGSQQDATVTNHYRLGIGTGNERGLLNEIQTDYGYRWIEGYSDATAGEQFYQVEDLLNNVNRISIGQYNNGQSSTNNQTVINSAGTGAVVLNGSNNSGTGGVIFGSGGATESTVATISNAGNAQFNGTVQVGGTAQSTGTMTVRNNADAEVDYYLWPGLTASQKGSYTYKDWNGNSQWYMVKDANNNWALNSAIGGLDSIKAYQSTNSGDTYVNASNSSGLVRINYESGTGTGFNVYGGNSSTLYASFTGTNAIKFPGLAAASGHNCVQVDSSGYLTNTGAACGAGSGGSGTVNSGSSGQMAYYAANGTTVGGITSVPVTAGGTGATSASAALTNLGAMPVSGGTMTGGLTVQNSADAEVDYTLWPGLTASQKGSFTYKDWNGNSQWYMVKDTNNNWSLNSALGGLDSFKAYQSSNSGDTYVNASNSSGLVRVNYESGSGAGFNVYGGSSSALYASFTGATSIKFPGLAASSGHNCLQVDNLGFVTNTGSACGTGSGGSGTVGSGTSGQIAYYSATGTTVGGISQIPVSAGGTGASSASGALTNLGAQAAIPGLAPDGANGIAVTGNVTADNTVAYGSVTGAKIGPVLECDQFSGADVSVKANACNAAAVAAGGGTIDLRTLLAGNTSGSQEIEIDTPAGNNALIGVTALLPTTGTYTSAMVGGPATSAAVYSNLGGTGYVTGDLVYPVEMGFAYTGTAAGAVFSATASGGVVTGLTLVSGGGGYLTSKYVTTTTNNAGSGLVINLAAADCGIRLNGRGTIQGGSVGAGAASFTIVPASGHSGFVMDSAFCTDQDSGYVRQEGGLKTSNFTGTPAFTYGTAHIRNVVDHSTFNLLETSSPSDDGALIESACCGASFFSLHADSGNTGGYPVIVGAGGVLKNACTTSGSTTITVPYGHLTAKYLGDTLRAGTANGISNLPAGTTIITAINSSTSMTVSQAATATSGGQAACTTPSLTGGSGLTLHVSDPTAATTTSISLHNLVANSAGTGLQNVLVTGQTSGANFYTAYVESNSAVDTATSQVYIGYPAGQVNFMGLYAPGPAAGGTKYGVESDTPFGWCMLGGISNAGLLDQGVKIPAASNFNMTYCKGGIPNAFNGTNLLPDTDFKQGTTYWTVPAGATITAGAGPAGDNALTFPLSSTASGTIYIPVTAAIPNLQANQTYTIGANINAATMTAGTISVELCSTPTCSLHYGDGFTSSARSGVVSGTVNATSFTGPYFVIVINGAAGSGTLSISEPFLVEGIVPAYIENDLGFGSATNSGAAFSSLALNGGTPWTSSSSANSQVVTCPPGGTIGQFCGADGAWHTPGTGTVTGVTAGTGLAGGGSSGSVTVSLSTPVAVANGGTGAATAGANTAFGNFASSAAAPAFTATTGMGSPVAAVSPTFTGNTTTFANNSANTDYVVIQPGNSSNAELGGIELNSAAATPVTEWYLEQDTSYDLKIHDQGATNPIDVFTAYVNGQTVINSQGTSAVAVNNTSNSGTGGFVVYEGGSNYNTAAFTVTSSGNASVPGTWTQKGITDETSAVAGGLVYNSSTSQQASSGLLTQYGLVYGGGASAAPASMAACGANFPVVGQAGAAPVCSTIGWLSSATQWGIPYMSTTTQMSTTAALTNNSLIRASSGAAPSASNLYDNSTDVYTAEPLFSASGSTTLAPATGIGTSWTSTGVAFPATVTQARVFRGHCHMIWQQITAVSTVTFGIGASVAPTAMYVSSNSSPGAYLAPYVAANITGTSTTAISTAIVPSAASTNYTTEIDVLGSFTSTANTVTIYAESGSATDTVSIEPGSYCTWLP